MGRKAFLEIITLQFQFFILIAAVVIIAIGGILISNVLTFVASQAQTNTALYAMMGSNDCTPETKILFKDVIAIGIAEGKRKASDTIELNRGIDTESVIINHCFGVFMERLSLPPYYLFYVEYPINSGNQYFKVDYYLQVGAAPTLNIVSVEYIALPNGDIAKAVFKTTDKYEPMTTAP